MTRSGASACSVIVCLAAPLACDTFYTVHGHVFSCADHRPISGAMVHLSDDQRGGFTKTAADGSYNVALNEPEGDGPSRLTLAKLGFRTEEHAVANPHVEQNVCLKPEEPQGR
jgi:hypothetical protein